MARGRVATRGRRPRRSPPSAAPPATRAKGRAPEPLDLRGVRTYPLESRRSKVGLADFARPHVRGARLGRFLEGLPRILGGLSFRALVDDVLRARTRGRPILWGLGAHVIKVGLSPVIVDLMERGLVTGLALNGAGIVHDFELAVAGQTSEDVSAGLGSGAFGMARETGEEINRAIVSGDADGLGLGASVGRYLAQRRPGLIDYPALRRASASGATANLFHHFSGTFIRREQIHQGSQQPFRYKAFGI